MTAQARWDEIRSIQRKYRWFYPFLGGIVFLLIGFVAGASLFQGDDNGFSYSTNLYTEFISIFITVVIVDRLNQWRDERNLKRRLIRESRSRDNSTAISAVDWMREELWLYGADSLLQNVDFFRANLEGADLAYVNLKGANLHYANLNNADLSGVNLEGANLRFANLKGADLSRANLKGADLTRVNLEGANLNNADLTDVTWLWEQEGISLDGVSDYAKSTYTDYFAVVLPDGTKWKDSSDVLRFIDIFHPDAWYPGKP